MTPPELTTAIVLFVLAGGLTIWSNTILSKAKKIAKEANIKCESVKEELASLQKQLDYYKRTEIKGDQLPVAFPIKNNGKEIGVFARYIVDKGVYADVLIKSFPIEDDKEFARLEAQELKDHLKEK
ncbi:MAG: hypothetical protein K2N48_01415 [Muribaculaceae bacterium]|nr:hypothetical protein [Muribaculaceae bacterium]